MRLWRGICQRATDDDAIFTDARLDCVTRMERLLAVLPGPLVFDEPRAAGWITRFPFISNANIAPSHSNGIAASDAANVGQVNSGAQAAESWAKSYVDQKLQNVDQILNAVSLRANVGLLQPWRGGIAASLSTQQNAAAVAFGDFHGQACVAVGVSTVSESGRRVYKLNMSGNTRVDVGASVGAAMTW